MKSVRINTHNYRMFKIVNQLLAMYFKNKLWTQLFDNIIYQHTDETQTQEK